MLWEQPTVDWALANHKLAISPHGQTSANPLGNITESVRNHLELIIYVAQMPSSKSMPEALQTLITEAAVTE
jgi:hypothetical protein